jgi:EAL domain-containing protein (putative c-di-GMP-specific phosphodiesterase class I)
VSSAVWDVPDARRDPDARPILASGGGDRMDTTTTSGARVLVLASESHVASDLCRMIERSGMKARAATQLDEFVLALRAWRPTHVALSVGLGDAEGDEAQRVLAEGALDGMVVVRGPLDQELIDTLRSEDRHAPLGPYAALRIERRPMRHGRRRTDMRGVSPTERRRDPRTIRRAVAELDAALDTQAFTVVFQPKVSALDGRAVAIEGLARWRLPDGSLVVPDRFIPLAEASGRIERLTDQIYRRALTWLGAELPDEPLRLCLNLSAHSLADTELAPRLDSLCDATGVPPDRIIIEITETSAAADPDTAQEVLTTLRELGTGVALDDFGAGHASLLQLARHPFTHLKIDRALVRTATSSGDSRTIIRAVTGLGRSLSLDVVAEGVEDAATLDTVTELGCQFLQGNHLARPMEGDALLGWLDRGGATWIAAPRRGSPSHRP